ncbi:MAG: mechanosensitive ion channel [Lentisphaeria bacterium]|nr:mechanosensitive ion channel [Lentisphaeria bacterium]
MKQLDTIQIIPLLILLTVLLKLLLYRLFDRFVKNPHQLHSFKDRINSLMVFTVLIIFSAIFFTEERETFFKYLSITSAGLAIALHDTISNFSGWLFIGYKKPFSSGDRIAVGDALGDVIQINLLFTTVLEVGNNRLNAEQSTGRIIHIPNSLILRKEVVNYNQGFNYIWHEMEVILTFESDWQKAKEILNEISNTIAGNFTELARHESQKAERMFEIRSGKLTPIVYVKVLAHGVGLTLRFIVEPRQSRTIESRLWETMLFRFNAEADVNFAYPTTRFYNETSGSKIENL